MYWLNNDETMVVADFFAKQFAGACVVRNADDGAHEVLPYTLERTSELATDIVNGLDGVSVELTGFVRGVNESMRWDLGRVYAAWYCGGGSFVGTFYLSGVDSDPTTDCTEQARLLAGDDSPTEPLEVHELGKWVGEQIVCAIKSEQFDGDIEVLFDNISRKLTLQKNVQSRDTDQKQMPKGIV